MASINERDHMLIFAKTGDRVKFIAHINRGELGHITMVTQPTSQTNSILNKQANTLNDARSR
jgi:hypothetical protein